ncbi:MAG: hypothetical protein RMX35_32845 [Nostoc sp. DcaGUA01]|nr:hypothetical protein [Nostoc sp. DcaGUA01]
MVKGIVKHKKSGFLESSSAGSDELSTSTRAMAQSAQHSCSHRRVNAVPAYRSKKLNNNFLVRELNINKYQKLQVF